MTIDNNDKSKNINSRKAEELADRLVEKYKTNKYRKWYLSSIYKLGFNTVLKIERKADKGKTPGRLFSFLLKERMDELDEKAEYSEGKNES